MNTRFLLKSLQVYGTATMFLCLIATGVFMTLNYPVMAFLFVAFAIGGKFIEQYGTTRLIYTEPLSLIMEKARHFQQEEDLLNKKV